jgi:2-keto-4-pentenoate hydratase/2-oxohepta-3-ene-1,7-dioic acid hydratase in catechol pathway
MRSVISFPPSNFYFPMRLATIQTWAGPRAALLLDDHYVDLHATDADLPANLRQLLEAGPAALRAAAEAARRPDAVRYPAAEVKFHAPIVDPRKIICIGLNYRDHAAESGSPIPRDPVLFSKFPTALVGHGEAIVLPKVSQEVDYEAELVIVIGKKGRHLSPAEAPAHVAGYTIGHDVSARDWQLKKDGKQWTIGKTFDTFAPVGPVLVTADEVADPERLPIRLRLNGQTMQDSNTQQLIFGVGALLAYLSQVFTLEPGDLIFTGTPPGVGIARKPPVFLKDGDVVEIEIHGLGILRNPIIREN